MKPEQEDKSFENAMRRAMGREEAQFDAAAWKAKHSEEITLLESRATAGANKWMQGRTIMSRRIIKIAASAAVAAVAVIVIFVAMTARDKGPSAAFASVLDRLKTTSYEFEMDISLPDGSGTSLACMVLEPGKMRLEQRNGARTITSIVDASTGKALVIFEQFKTAFRVEENELKDLWAAGFLMLPGRSIENLWNLRAGKETDLGKREIAGVSAEGFRVAENHDAATEMITVWADAKTHAPLTVEVVWQEDKETQQPVSLTLRNFTILESPDAALFSTDVPDGYTTANETTLEEYLTGQTSSEPSVGTASPAAQKVLQAIDLWTSANNNEAIDMLLAVDWEGDFEFGREDYIFTMTERQVISLANDDQRKVLEQVMEQSPKMRAVARELVALGGSARDEKDTAKAQKYFNAAAGLGRLLDRDKEGMVIVRLVGIAIQKMAFTKLESLYEETGNADGLAAVRDQLRLLDEEQADIKGLMTGQ